MDRFTAKDLEARRAEALFYLAHPDYRNGTAGPVYSKDRVNSTTLALVIRATPQNIARYLGPDGVGIFAEELAKALGAGVEEVLKTKPEDIVEAVEGEECFVSLARDYIASVVMGNVDFRQDVYCHVSPDTIDRYAWQLFEEGEALAAAARLSYPVTTRLLSLKLTKSLKNPKLMLGHKPKEKCDKGRPFVMDAVKFGKGFNLERDLRPFAEETIIPIARRNLRELYEGEVVTPEMFHALSRESAESARVLGIQ